MKKLLITLLLASTFVGVSLQGKSVKDTGKDDGKWYFLKMKFGTNPPTSWPTNETIVGWGETKHGYDSKNAAKYRLGFNNAGDSWGKKYKNPEGRGYCKGYYDCINSSPLGDNVSIETYAKNNYDYGTKHAHKFRVSYRTSAI